MYNKFKRWGVIAVVALPLVFGAGVVSASVAAGQNRPQGADYLSWSGNSSQQSVPGNGFKDNGVAGTVAALDVPEPSSIVIFAGGLTLLGFACAARRRTRRDREMR